MKLTIEIRMDNAAFEDDASIEAARILGEMCTRIEGHPHFSPGHSQPLRDASGNEVGFFEVTE